MIRFAKITHTRARSHGNTRNTFQSTCVQIMKSIQMKPKSRRGIFSYWFLVKPNINPFTALLLFRRHQRHHRRQFMTYVHGTCRYEAYVCSPRKFSSDFFSTLLIRLVGNCQHVQRLIAIANPSHVNMFIHIHTSKYIIWVDFVPFFSYSHPFPHSVLLLQASTIDQFNRN